jgi:type IV secretory pathway TraG/TraD family ATPase VirD4
MRLWKGTACGFESDGTPIDYNADDEAAGNAPCTIIGPQGTNKTVGLLVPQLLDDNSGARNYYIFGDAKGELYSITHKFRSTVSHVAVANYAGVLGIKSDKWNPLNHLDPKARGYGDACQAIAIAIVPPEPNDHNKHFTDGTRSAATLAIMRTVRRAEGRIRDMRDVREFLLQDPDKLKAEIEKIVETGNYDEHTRAAKFLKENTEIQNLKSTMEVATSWMTEDICEDMATEKGLDFRNNNIDRVKTVYSIIPPDEMTGKGPYVRLQLSSALRGLYRHDGMPTTVIIEEAYVTGHHEEILKALSILRSFNSRLTIVFQSYAQITELYPKTHGLFTSGTLISFRSGDIETAEMLVKRAGKKIVPVLSAADPSSPGEIGVRPSWQQQQRDRVPLDQMFGMPRGRALVWKPGDAKPRMSWVKGYFEIPELNKRVSPNPHYKGTAATATVSENKAPARRSSTSWLGFAIAALIVGLLVLLH